MTIDLAGRTILVTGASKGIGAAIVKEIGACGAHVIAQAPRRRRAPSHASAFI